MGTDGQGTDGQASVPSDRHHQAPCKPLQQQQRNGVQLVLTLSHDKVSGKTIVCCRVFGEAGHRLVATRNVFWL